MRDSLVIGGHDMSAEFDCALGMPYTLGDPVPRTSYVDVPGGGVLDLTDALGATPYTTRDMSFALYVERDGAAAYQATVSAMRRAVHGRECDVTCSLDPGYAYHGRVTLADGGWAGGYGTVTVSVHADAWKRAPARTLRLDGAGGRWFRLESGTRPVRPTVTCDAPVAYATRDGACGTVGAGSHVLRDVVLTGGWNDLYLKTRDLSLVTWADLAEGGAHPLTWEGASSRTWDGLQLLGMGDERLSATWGDLAGGTWGALAERRWRDMLPPADLAAPPVYVTYEWMEL